MLVSHNKQSDLKLHLINVGFWSTHSGVISSQYLHQVDLVKFHEDVNVKVFLTRE